MLERDERVLVALRAVLAVEQERGKDAVDNPDHSADRHEAYRQRLLDALDHLHKRMQISLLLLEQPISRVGQQFEVLVPIERDALPEIFDAKPPRWWPKAPKRKIEWERP